MNILELSEQEIVRRQSLQTLRDMGIDPYPAAEFPTNAFSTDIRSEFKDEDEPRQVMIAGRLMGRRVMGKASFAEIQDSKGRIQVYVSRDEICHGDNKDLYNLVFKKLMDIGDFIGVKGFVFRTQTGEISVHAQELTLLSKSLKPLPIVKYKDGVAYDKFDDPELRYRQRYVDLVVNDGVKDTFLKRATVLRTLRKVLDEAGYTEVETPTLQSIAGGASARPFITHFNALDQDMYMRIATELYLKRLIVGGFEGVYEIGRLFRNEGMDAMHNPEFTTVEAYVAYSDLHGMMDLIEGLFDSVANEVLGTTDITYQGTELSLKAPFKRIHMVDAIKEACGVDFWQDMSYEEAVKLAEEHDIEVEKIHNTVGHIINLFFEKYVEETIVQPTFVYGHPTSISPLAKKNKKDPRFADRYELFICGHEYANAFSELNDPIDQRERFEKQLELRELGDDEANEVDTDYVEALEYGLPPTGGVGLGIDRFVMLLTDQRTIREVLLFPHMKNLGDSNKKAEAKKPVEAAPVKVDFSNVKIEPIFTDMVDFETFSKSDFRAVKVLACEAVEKSKKLLKFTLDDGERKDRVILSGIHEYYEPEELVGKTAIAIVNLPPRKMMGINSEGVLISAVHEEDGHECLNLLMVDDNIPAGAKLY